jgi:hypothetical protein
MPNSLIKPNSPAAAAKCHPPERVNRIEQYSHAQQNIARRCNIMFITMNYFTMLPYMILLMCAHTALQVNTVAGSSGTFAEQVHSLYTSIVISAMRLNIMVTFEIRFAI